MSSKQVLFLKYKQQMHAHLQSHDTFQIQYFSSVIEHNKEQWLAVSNSVEVPVGMQKVILPDNNEQHSSKDKIK